MAIVRIQGVKMVSDLCIFFSAQYSFCFVPVFVSISLSQLGSLTTGQDSNTVSARQLAMVARAYRPVATVHGVANTLWRSEVGLRESEW
jgi:hypothetical protein